MSEDNYTRGGAMSELVRIRGELEYLGEQFKNERQYDKDEVEKLATDNLRLDTENLHLVEYLNEIGYTDNEIDLIATGIVDPLHYSESVEDKRCDNEIEEDVTYIKKLEEELADVKFSRDLQRSNFITVLGMLKDENSK
jgi:uncharacterized protein YkuJ